MGKVRKDPSHLQKHLPVHGNLIRYYDSDVFRTDGVIQGVIITEHCEGGVLSDVVTQTYPQTLSEKMILGILRDLLCALYTLHSSSPPMSHRNINVFYINVSIIQLATLYLCPLEWSMQIGSRSLHDLQYHCIHFIVPSLIRHPKAWKKPKSSNSNSSQQLTPLTSLQNFVTCLSLNRASPIEIVAQRSAKSQRKWMCGSWAF